MELSQTAHSFVRRYPLSLREVIATPMIFRENVPGFDRLPFPTVDIIRDLAALAGYGDGALRTAMSRVKASGELKDFVDEAGTRRFRLTPMQESVSRVVRDRRVRPDGFIVGVFSFHAREEVERRAVRENLKYFGFKRIAQNTYINGTIDTSGLEAELARAGVSDRFYLFRCPSIDDETLLARLAEVFDVKARERTLKRFRVELTRFLEEPGLDEMELGRRVFYAGPVHHRMCFTEEPPVPAHILPESYPLRGLTTYLGAVITNRRKKIEAYYRTLCESISQKGDGK
jgi:DNA-binding transcriptional regulator PaaX